MRQRQIQGTTVNKHSFIHHVKFTLSYISLAEQHDVELTKQYPAVHYSLRYTELAKTCIRHHEFNIQRGFPPKLFTTLLEFVGMQVYTRCVNTDREQLHLVRFADDIIVVGHYIIPFLPIEVFPNLPFNHPPKRRIRRTTAPLKIVM